MKTKEKIIINDLKVNCVIGVYDHERAWPQDIFVTIELTGTFACQSGDQEGEFICYTQYAALVKDMLAAHQYRLVETAASSLAQELIKMDHVDCAKVMLKKPSAISQAQSLAYVYEVKR